jgi:AcrR family transcriptional regulator
MSPSAEDRRQQILDAAGEVFARKGFKGASIKELAAAANVSPGLLYWYFQDKAQLFNALLEHKITGALGSISDHVSPDLLPDSYLVAFGNYYVRQIETSGNTALFKMMLANSHALPAEVHRVQAHLVGSVLAILRDYLEGQIAAGRIRPCNTEMVARTFMGSIVAYLMLKHVLQDPASAALPAETLIAGVSDVILRGILPDASAAPAHSQEAR